MKRICLLDLNYTLVGNQATTRMLRPFSRRMEAEEYRADLIEAIKDDYVIIVTARPDYQMKQTMENIKRKTGWQPQEWYFNDINGEPPGLQGERPPAVHLPEARERREPLLRCGEQPEDPDHVCPVWD